MIDTDFNNIGLVIDIDSNCWGGPDIIPNDPNNQNLNGGMLDFFLKRNKGIKLVNFLPICDGLITRQRVTEKKSEK